MEKLIKGSRVYYAGVRDSGDAGAGVITQLIETEIDTIATIKMDSGEIVAVVINELKEGIDCRWYTETVDGGGNESTLYIDSGF